MPKTVKQLQELMIDQLKRRGYYPQGGQRSIVEIG